MSRRVCIFDIDNTLTHGDNAKCPSGVQKRDVVQPAWPEKGSGTTSAVLDTLRACREKGYEVAIATAESANESNVKRQREFLSSLDPDVFTPSFFSSPRMQNACSVIKSSSGSGEFCKTNEYPNKTAMYQNIMNYYNIPPTEWKRSVVFDDAAANLTTASGLGFKVCQASPECGGVYCNQGCAIPESCIGVL